MSHYICMLISAHSHELAIASLLFCMHAHAYCSFLSNCIHTGGEYTTAAIIAAFYGWIDLIKYLSEKEKLNPRGE